MIAKPIDVHTGALNNWTPGSTFRLQVPVSNGVEIGPGVWKF
jgi:hypothetical protein